MARRTFQPPGDAELSALRREAMEFAGIGVFRYLADGTISYMDGPTLRLLGVEDQFDDPTALIGRDIGTLFEYEQPRGSLRARVLAEGQVRDLEYSFRTFSGERRWVLHNAYRVEDRQTGETAIQVIARDITDAKRTEQAMLRSEDKTRALLSAIPDMMFRLSRDGVFLEFFSSTPERLYVDPQRILGARLHDLMPRIADRAMAAAEEALATGTVASFEYTLPMPDGIGHFEARHVPFGDDEVLAIIRDLTEQRRAEHEQRQLHQRIEQGQKLESLGLLAGGIAHDFNNLLTGVLGQANLARDEVDPSSPLAARLDRIERAAQRAADLTAELLAYAGRGAVVEEVVELSALVREMVELLETAIARQAQLQLELGTDALTVLADPTRLRQVVMNLITNAVQSLGDLGGTVTVKTSLRRLEADELRDGIGELDPPAGEYAVLEVADTGSGMDARTVAQIFEPFFSTRGAGRGLGLAAALGIVRAHHGVIRVDSTPGHGTRVQVALPRSDTPWTASPEETSVELENAAPLVGLRALVVDDEEPVREVVRSALERAGMAVWTADDGLAAVQRFEGDPAAIDVVLLDMSMPGMDGAETLEALRAIRGDVPVLLISGFTEDHTRVRTDVEREKQPEPAFLQKPFRAPELLKALRRLLRAE